MNKRFVSISFPYLVTDWWTVRQPHLKNIPVVVCIVSHGRKIITAVNIIAQRENIVPGMVLADARAILPNLHVIDDEPGLTERLLKKIAEWCFRFTPVTSADLPDGILMDISGCAHLWGGEEKYIVYLINKLIEKGYSVKAAIANTIGTAWGVARFANYQYSIVKSGNEIEELSLLSPAALRINPEILIRLHKLGMATVGDFIHMPEQTLFRRFGPQFIQRLKQAIGTEEENVEPVFPVQLYCERLPCLEPILYAEGIDIAMRKLVETLCDRLKKEEKGIRKAIFKCLRVDNKFQQVEISTNRPSCNVDHLMKLLSEKIERIEPGPGIELFILEAPVVEHYTSRQESLWESAGVLNDMRLSEFIDRLSSRIGENSLFRFVPSEHYWPERSFKKILVTDKQNISIPWNTNKPRPVYLLSTPEEIQVTAPIPDYPPMMFHHKGKLHKVKKADGPERIEQEWWIQEGEHRDYYYIEDDDGCRYWLFRSGHYGGERPAQWFLHGYCF